MTSPSKYPTLALGMSDSKEKEELELTFALKHIEQHLGLNDSNSKKLLKLQQRIMAKEKLISCKGAVKIFQAYESILHDIQSNINTVELALRICVPNNQEGLRTSLDIKSYSENNEFSTGKIVAALTLTAEGSEEWILARIKSFDGRLYTVEDAEIEEEPTIEIAQKELYSIKPSNIILIPETVDIALARPEFRLKQKVLALFPGTTCFYTSTVMSQPSRRKKTRDYLLKFSDDDVSSRPCSSRYVLPSPESK